MEPSSTVPPNFLLLNGTYDSYHKKEKLFLFGNLFIWKLIVFESLYSQSCFGEVYSSHLPLHISPFTIYLSTTFHLSEVVAVLVVQLCIGLISYKKTFKVYKSFSIRNHFISHLVLDSQKLNF